MEKIKMMKKLDSLIDRNFKYIFKKEHANLSELHYTFKMDSTTHELQAGIQFEDTFADVLVFISLTALNVDSQEYFEAIKACNYINMWIKAFGRFYVDAYGDLAYSLRLSYDFIEREPELAVREIEVAIDYYADLFIPLLDVCLGKMAAKDIEKYVDTIWKKINP